MFRPKIPFFHKLSHKRQIWSSYRSLLRLAHRFTDPVERTYLHSWIRERFHTNTFQTSPQKVATSLSDAKWAELVLASALDGNASQQQLISDLAYARTGYLHTIRQRLAEFHHPTKSCQLIRDVRPSHSRRRQPHPAYRIPVDPRAIPIPPHLLARIHDEDAREQRRLKALRTKRDRARARQISALAAAVNQGSCAMDSGLVPGAFMPSDSLPGINGNPAYLPPKPKFSVDPPLVQHVRASSGFEFLRVNSRKPSHALSARIAKSFRDVAKWLHRHEFFFYFTEDLKLEEEFEQRLGIEDPGYWVYARNYRNFLRNRIRTFAQQTESVENPDISRMIREGMPEYRMLEEYLDSYDRKLDAKK
ncbi:hypothetical protein EC988_002111 [Linderina pennispora]|nr:hypothetical protein EC988_002111 [Linderina pennispora]